MKTVIIFGGSGFIGRHIIRRLVKNAYRIIIPHQTKVNEAKLRLLGTTGQIIPISYKHLNEKHITNAFYEADIIINLKTLWDEKKITFKKGILDFNINLVNIIANLKKNPKFIYFSGIGIDQNIESNRSKNILFAEQYIQKNLNNSIIVRPGVVLGGEDNFLKGLLPLFKISFFIPLFGNGLSKFHPVFVDDVSIAINKILETDIQGKHIYEFVGPEIFTYKDFYNFLAECFNKKRVLIPAPLIFVKMVVSILDKTPFSPLNLEQLKLFENDNITSGKYKNFSDLGIFPQDLRIIIKKIVKKYT